jgi:hypothetical protein
MRGMKLTFYFYDFNPFVLRINLTLQTQCYIYFGWRFLQLFLIMSLPRAKKRLIQKIFITTKRKEENGFCETL